MRQRQGEHLGVAGRRWRRRRCDAAGVDERRRDNEAADAAIRCGTTTPAAGQYALGGVATGILGTGLVLATEDGDTLSVSHDGSFVFPTKHASGYAYSVSVQTQPTAPSQTCVVAGGTGVIASGDVSTVAVVCGTDQYPVGGTVSGLAGSGLTVQVNGLAQAIISANGTFSFTGLPSGALFDVEVTSQPRNPNQTCTVTNGQGHVSDRGVTDVAVVCTTNQYSIRGTAVGVVGTGLVLRNGGDMLPVGGDGSFVFTRKVASGAPFDVEVMAQPSSPAQVCTVSGNQGSVLGSDVASVVVNCRTNTYTVGGTVRGLNGSGLLLTSSSGDSLSVTANGTYAFPTPLASGAAYQVTLKTQPTAATQVCVFSSGTSGSTSNSSVGTAMSTSGVVGDGNVTLPDLVCTTQVFQVSATVSGLNGSGLVIQDNGVDTLSASVNGVFKFPAFIPSGSTYLVSVKTNPTTLSQTCAVTNGNGVIGGSDVTNVQITCVTNTYTVGGSVAGLTGVGLTLKLNGTSTATVSPPAVAGNNVPYTFTQTVPSGGMYTVAITQQPSSPAQTCTIAPGTSSGPVTNGNVTTVNVNCTTNQFIGGTAPTFGVQGLAGMGLVLQNNGGDNQTVNGNGTFTFPTPLPQGSTYNATVLTQPTSPAQVCVVTNGSGPVGATPVNNILVSCCASGQAYCNGSCVDPSSNTTYCGASGFCGNPAGGAGQTCTGAQVCASGTCKDPSYSSCADALAQNPGASSGLYPLSVNGSSFTAYCDMTTAGGGWTLIVLTNGNVAGTPDVSFAAAKATAVNVNGTVSSDLNSFDFFMGTTFWNAVAPSQKMLFKVGTSKTNIQDIVEADFTVPASGEQIHWSGYAALQGGIPNIDYNNDGYLQTSDAQATGSVCNCAGTGAGLGLGGPRFYQCCSNVSPWCSGHGDCSGTPQMQWRNQGSYTTATASDCSNHGEIFVR